MAKLLTAFDATQWDPAQITGQLPIGVHPVVIESSEVKENSKNSGGFLELGLKVIDGPAVGSTGIYRLHLYHDKAQTVEIAHRRLSTICHAIGVYSIQDSSQLHNLPFMIEVDLQKSEEAAAKGYTEVKKIFDIKGNEPGKQFIPPAPVQSVKPVAPVKITESVKLPWMQ